MQNGDITHRIQIIDQNGKDIPFISIDSLRGFLNRYIEKIDISKFSIYRPISNCDVRYLPLVFTMVFSFRLKVNISESWNYEITPWKLRGDMEWSEFFDVYYTLHIYVGFRWKEIIAVPDAPVMEIDLAAWQVDVCRTGGWRSLVECRMRG